MYDEDRNLEGVRWASRLAKLNLGGLVVLAYLIQLGRVPFAQRAERALARRVERVFGPRPHRLAPAGALKALSRRRLGLVRFGESDA